MITIGHCTNCGNYYGRKYTSLADLYNDETQHICKEKEVQS